MNWDFFEDWADVPQEDRAAILKDAYFRPGSFRDLVLDAPKRNELNDIRRGLADYKRRSNCWPPYDALSL